MIRMILQGGLGNQMFEYASVFSLAKETGTELVLDKSFFNVYGNRAWCRPYELEVFALSDTTKTVSRSQLAVRVLPKLLLYCWKQDKYHLGRYLFDANDWKEAKTHWSSVLYGYFAH